MAGRGRVEVTPARLNFRLPGPVPVGGSRAESGRPAGWPGGDGARELEPDDAPGPASHRAAEGSIIMAVEPAAAAGVNRNNGRIASEVEEEQRLALALSLVQKLGRRV